MIIFWEIHATVRKHPNHLDVEVTQDNLEVIKTLQEILVGGAVTAEQGILWDACSTKSKV